MAAGRQSPCEGAPPALTTSSLTSHPPVLLPFDASLDDGTWPSQGSIGAHLEKLISAAKSTCAHAIALLQALLMLAASEAREAAIPAAAPDLDKEFGFQLEELRKEMLMGRWASRVSRVPLLQWP